MTEVTEKLERLRQAQVVLCSACLLGCRSRYDGTDKLDPRVLRLLGDRPVVPICPETAGGLPIPRPPADFVGGDGQAVLDAQARVVSREGTEVTEAYLRGANLALQAARLYGATVALLKESSPSCGTHRVHIEGLKVPGMGVAAAALARAGLVVLSDEELPADLP
ncbi:MAG TPA: DUF523 domain-containing protein [Myxococcales bacterium]|jgi:uncharacterized protein YbbK (DUF523 family)|nr:DUF523 domain-containing protein [Myxococcales bacterium]